MALAEWFIYLNYTFDKQACFSKLSKESNQFQISPYTWKIKT